jgi:DNA polymerase III subunit delta
MLGHVVLITGKEELLRQRLVSEFCAAVKVAHPDVEVAQVDGANLHPGDLGELVGPSLFAESRCVVINSIEQASDDSAQALVNYSAQPAPDISMILVHSGGAKGSGLLTKLRKLATVQESKVTDIKPNELVKFVSGEMRRRQASVEEAALPLLISAIGSDLRALAAAAEQLAQDFPEIRITTEIVQRYFGGRAEAKSFAVADAAFGGRRPLALEELRWALATGTPPLLVTAAFAGSARAIAKFLGAPRGLREGDLAAEVGVPPWKLRTIRDQARHWQEPNIAQAIQAVAKADSEVKGAASDPEYSLERLVLRVAELRSRHLSSL